MVNLGVTIAMEIDKFTQFVLFDGVWDTTGVAVLGLISQVVSKQLFGVDSDLSLGKVCLFGLRHDPLGYPGS